MGLSFWSVPPPSLHSTGQMHARLLGPARGGHGLYEDRKVPAGSELRFRCLSAATLSSDQLQPRQPAQWHMHERSPDLLSHLRKLLQQASTQE